MAVIQRTLTEAHHHLGDILDQVKHQHVIMLVNATRDSVAAVIVAPEVWEALNARADSAHQESEADNDGGMGH